MVDDGLEDLFPNLARETYRVTSPATPRYNDIAWAAADASDWWWPATGARWPAIAVREETLEAFTQAFEALGYELCDGPEWKPGLEIVAIYALEDGTPKHAARRIPSGAWTSKFGRGMDIEHVTLDALGGSIYGQAVRFLKRPAPSSL